jgi:2-hydroxychromene-2-carboxylate isomerase
MEGDLVMAQTPPAQTPSAPTPAAKTVEFVFDFGSPNAYLAWKVLPGMLAGTGAGLTLVPALLGGIFKATGNQAPMLAFGGVKGKLAYEQREMERFIARHQLTDFRFNPHFPVNTLLLMRGLTASRPGAERDAYVAAGLKAMWEDGEKMDDPEVFQRVMTAAGLDGADLLARTQDPEVKATLVRNTEAVVARGVFGIPSFFVGDEMFFGKDRLEQVVEQLRA